MLFKEAYKYLTNIKGKSLNLKELNNFVAQTEQFECPVDGYLLTDCIVNNSYCSFNSFADDKGNVIAIDISFDNINELHIIKEMSWNTIDECNKFIIQVIAVDLLSY
ncbi:hypothetical protein FDA33_09955 [Clostridium botulinum]|uniref:Uncharacterized protein n=1 Tax=Clostridium botulinum TaxID=1491 RepID=A0A126JHP6_CLOBO|nr:hypothetical protein [Clostridium botulinum]ALT05315.1 hypothetical protein [Clostridium botulinum]NFH90515.1 hypothetical protein [Clostridium botulinum]NFI19541.1 hypothetical protein [Clostridium botulinum]NFN06136.1 hypothetical protein [Clostridium botulinum]NFN19468.1 hypothetical protein [Clostridium botulinum]